MLFGITAGMGALMAAGLPAFLNTQIDKQLGAELHKIGTHAEGLRNAGVGYPDSEIEFLKADSPHYLARLSVNDKMKSRLGLPDDNTDPNYYESGAADRDWIFRSSPDDSCWIAAGVSNTDKVIVVSSSMAEREYHQVKNLDAHDISCLGTIGTQNMIRDLVENPNYPEGSYPLLHEQRGHVVAGVLPPKEAPIAMTLQEAANKSTMLTDGYARFEWDEVAGNSYEVRVSEDSTVWKTLELEPDKLVDSKSLYTKIGDKHVVYVFPKKPLGEVMQGPATRHVGIEVRTVNDTSAVVEDGYQPDRQPPTAKPTGVSNQAIPGYVSMSRWTSWSPANNALDRGNRFEVPRASTLSQKVKIPGGIESTYGAKLWIKLDYSPSDPKRALPTVTVEGTDKTDELTLAPNTDGFQILDLGHVMVGPDEEITVTINGEGQLGNNTAVNVLSAQVVVIK